MKSKFAKFIDATLGALLVFAAATAILRYYTTLELAAFCGTAVAASVILIAHATGKRKADAQKLSRAAADMFFDFMFLDERAPAKLLYAGLKFKAPNATLRGNGVYLGKTAAFCCFDRNPDEKTLARCVAKAKRGGADKVVVLCKSVGGASIDIADYPIRLVGGDDVYKLFASLSALPESKFSHKRKTRRAAFAGALGKDKIVRYVMLAVGFFAVYMITRRAYVMLACAIVCATLAAVSIAVNIVKKIKN